MLTLKIHACGILIYDLLIFFSDNHAIIGASSRANKRAFQKPHKKSKGNFLVICK
jgi:hypothetical protein